MVKEPSKATLKKYGLTLEVWRDILHGQGGVCWVCEKVPPSGILCIDHWHVKGYKRMPPEKKRLYVRGLLCAYCNLRLLRKGWTLKKLLRAVTYMSAFIARLEQAGINTDGV